MTNHYSYTNLFAVFPLGVEAANEYISNRLENCQSGRFSSDLSDNSSSAYGSTLLCCRVCGKTFTEPIALQGHDCTDFQECSRHCDSCGKDFTSPVNFENHPCKAQGKPVHSVSSKSKVVLQPSIKRGTQNSLLQKCRLEAGELTHNMRSHGRMEKNGKRSKKINDISNEKLNHNAKGNVEEGGNTKEAELQERSEEISENKNHDSCQEIENSKNYRDKLRCKKRGKNIKKDTALKKHKRTTIQKNSKKTSDGRFNRTRQTVDNPFKCTHCYKTFKYSCNLSSHLRGHSKDQLQCNSGAKTSNLSEQCSVRESHYECVQCQKFFATVEKLELHKKTHDRPYQCEECEQRFSDITLLTEHQKCHSNEKLHVCGFCDKSFKHKNSLRIHRRNHRDSNFVCNKCNESFRSEKALKRHLSSHVVMKTFNCEYCSKIFHLTEVYKRHLKKYHDKNKEVEGDNFKCVHCHKGYATSYRLKKHMVKHTGKKVKCNECGKFFIDNHDLKKHLRTHTGERPFKCSECSWAFSQSSQLNRHLRCVHGKSKKTPSDLHKRFPCDICSREFFDISNLERHFLIHTGEKPFCCEFCNVAFREKHHLTRHLKSRHSRKKKSNKEGTTSANRENGENQGDATIREKNMGVTVAMNTDVRSSVIGDGNQGEMKSSPLNERKRKSRLSSGRLSQETENPFFPSQSSSQPPVPAVSKHRRASSDYKSVTEANENFKEQSKSDSHVTEQSTVPFPISSTSEPTKRRSFQTDYTPATIEEKPVDSSGQPSMSVTDSDEKKKAEFESIVEKIIQKNRICQKSPPHRNESSSYNQQSKLALRLIEPLPLSQNPCRKLQTPPASPKKLVAAVKDKNSISSEKMSELKRTMELRRQLSFGTISRSVGESTPSGEGKGKIGNTSGKYLEQKTTLAQRNPLSKSQAVPQKKFFQQDHNCQMEKLSKASVIGTTAQLSLGNNDAAAQTFSIESAVSFDSKKFQKQCQVVDNRSPEQIITDLPPVSRHINDSVFLGVENLESSLSNDITSFKDLSNGLGDEENESESFEDKELFEKGSRMEEVEEGEIDEEEDKGKSLKETKDENGRGKEKQQKQSVNEEESYVFDQKEYKIEGSPANHSKNKTSNEVKFQPAKKEEIKESTENVSQVVAIEKDQDRALNKDSKEINVTVDGEEGYRETEEDNSQKENEAVKDKKDAWPTHQEEKKEVNNVDHEQLKESREDEKEVNHQEIRPSCRKVLKESERDEKERNVKEEHTDENVMQAEKDYEDTIKLEPKDRDVMNDEEGESKELKKTEKQITQSGRENELPESTNEGNCGKVTGNIIETPVGDKFEVRFKSKQTKEATNDKVHKSERNEIRQSSREEVNESHEDDKEENHQTEQKSKSRESQGGNSTRPNNKSEAEAKEKSLGANLSQQCSEVSSSNENSPRWVNPRATKGKGKLSKGGKRKVETGPLAKSSSARETVKLSSGCHQNALREKQSSAKKIVKQNYSNDSRAASHSTFKDRNTSNTSRVNSTHAYTRSDRVSPSHRSKYTRRSPPAREPRQQMPEENIFKHSRRESRRYRSPSPEIHHRRHNYRSKERFPAHSRGNIEPIRRDDYRNEALIRRNRNFAQDEIGLHPVTRRWEEKRFPTQNSYRKMTQHHRKYNTCSRFYGEPMNDSGDIPPLLPEKELHEIMSKRNTLGEEDDRQFSDRGYKRDERSGSRFFRNHQESPRDRIQREELTFSNERQNHYPHQRDPRHNEKFHLDQCGGWQDRSSNEFNPDCNNPYRRPSYDRQRTPFYPESFAASPPRSPDVEPTFGYPPVPKPFRGFPLLISDDLPGIVPLPFKPWNR